MFNAYIQFNSVSYTYPNSITTAVQLDSLHLSKGWVAFAGANGAGKTTALKLATGILVPSVGTVQRIGSAVYCRQRTDTPPDNLSEFAYDWSGEAILLRDKLQLGDDWFTRWDTLSHGERKRLQIAVALWRKPAILALDEPFNHLDSKGKDILVEALKQFDGCGLLVTHDRQIMDDICMGCLLFYSDETIFYKANYSSAKKAEKQRQKQLIFKREKAKTEYQILKRDARKKMLQARTIQAHSSMNNVSFKDICKFNLDGPSRIDSIVQKAGQRSRVAKARAENAFKKMESITYRRKYNSGIKINWEISSRNYLLDISKGAIPIGDKQISFPDCLITKNSRIALTGANGSGKTTFLNYIRPKLNCRKEEMLWIPQEISSKQSSLIIKKVQALSSENLGKIMIMIRHLGSDPKRILNSKIPSPGESRKLLLATGLINSTLLIVMDEPTNHIDLPSIECLENALNSYNGALILVSHDKQFLTNTTNTEWNIKEGVLRKFAKSYR